MERINKQDLRRLNVIAADDEAALFTRLPCTAGRYAGRLICRALCQGAALHYVNGTNGVKDFDVWSFYAAIRGARPYPYRRNKAADFGPSKFGRLPQDPARFTGRRVDLLGRSLPCRLDDDPADVMRGYLQARQTKTARALALKAAVLIWPEDRVGDVVWTPSLVAGIGPKQIRVGPRAAG